MGRGFNVSRSFLSRLFAPLAAVAARHGRWFANVALSLLLAALGLFWVQWRELLWPRFRDEIVDWAEMGMDALQRFSFDVPFLIRNSLPAVLRNVAGPPHSTDEIVILYMDEESTRRLEQPPGGPWSRAMHARLLNWLAKDGARAVLFDVVFDSDSPDDAVLAEAIAKHGNTYLGAAVILNTEAPLTPEEKQRLVQLGFVAEKLSRRSAALYKAARGWGLLTFQPVDSDYGVRRLFVGKPREGLDAWPTATWELAQALGAKLPEDDETRFSRRWLNYYGPARRIESISYYRALVTDGGVPPGYFKDKVVFIGARSQIGSDFKKLLDEFSTPWSRFRGRAYTPGTEIHATILLNLLHHDWLSRLPSRAENWSVALLGLALGSLCWLRPWRALAVALIAALAVFSAACVLQWRANIWFNWAVPLFIQIPAAAVLAVGSRYYLEERRRRKLRNAFGLYLSPELADQIAEQDFPLAPGGTKVLATLVFTDLQGFTTLSERLDDPVRIGELLTDYFSRTTDEILAEHGTVIKFIGDAVFAAWGAPVSQADHALRAVRAAWQLSQVSSLEISTPGYDGSSGIIRLKTRVGIHTGEALAGNLGSRRRFDYTLVGDAVNFASRLEGANKHLGTSVLLSDDTARRLNGQFLLRRVGRFTVVGKVKPVLIHELLGPDPTVRPAWLEQFEAALAAWNVADFATARAGFSAVIAERNGIDGPSRFYLDRINRAIPASGWTGEVALEEK